MTKVTFVIFIMALWAMTSVVSAEVCGIVTQVKGSVAFVGGADVSRHARVCVGQTIFTGVDGKVRVDMPDRNQWVLMQASNLTLVEYGNHKGEHRSTLKLNSGKARVWLSEPSIDSGQFTFRTPKTAVTVLSSDMLVGFDPRSGSTNFTVFKGEIRWLPGVSSDQPFSLTAGQEVVVDSNGRLGGVSAVDGLHLRQLKMAMAPPAQSPILQKVQVASQDDIAAFDRLIKAVPEASREKIRKIKDQRVASTLRHLTKESSADSKRPADTTTFVEDNNKRGTSPIFEGRSGFRGRDSERSSGHRSTSDGRGLSRRGSDRGKGKDKSRK